MNFYQKVYTVVPYIPLGKVATYGQIAALCSSPRAARQVGYALRALPELSRDQVPWHRVVSKSGAITIMHTAITADTQMALLRSEGVACEQRNGLWYVALPDHLWHPSDVEKRGISIDLHN